MHYSKVDAASYTLRQMRDLEHDRDGAKFGVTIGGRYQDEAMLAAVNGAIVAELQRRIDALKAKLVEMGVDID